MTVTLRTKDGKRYTRPEPDRLFERPLPRGEEEWRIRLERSSNLMGWAFRWGFVVLSGWEYGPGGFRDLGMRIIRPVEDNREYPR